MRLRKAIAALALGIPATLIVHVLAFGGDHEAGGQFHCAFVAVAAIATLGFFLAFAALAWASRNLADGSILAVRLAEPLPGTAAIALSAAVFFQLCEVLEPAHDGRSALLVTALILLSSSLVRWFARAVVSIIAAATIAVARLGFASRRLTYVARHVEPLRRQRAIATQRRFVRPPPPLIHGLARA